MKLALLPFLLLAFAIPAAAQPDLYDPGVVHEIRIRFAEKNWRTVLDSLFRTEGDKGKLIGDVTVDGHLCRGAGVRYKGYSSYNASELKNPFNIDLNYTLLHQSHQGYVKLKLSNVIQDPSFLREVLSYEIAAKYMPVSRAAFADVYVNDTLVGLYTSVEAVDEIFIEKRWGSAGNTFFKGEPNKLLYPFGQNANLALTHGSDSSDYKPYYKMESAGGWGDLYRLILQLDKGADSAAAILNTDRALWMHAFNEVVVNLDSYIGYSQNYYMYRDNSGRFNPILWDMNMSFGSFRDSDASYNFGGMTIRDAKELDPLGLMDFAVSPRPLMTKLFENDRLKRTYFAHMRTILDQNIRSGWYMQRGQALQDLVNSHVLRDTNRFYSYQDFLSNLNVTVGGTGGMNLYPGIRELMEARLAYLDTLPGFSGQPIIATVAHNPETPSFGGQCTVTAQVSGSTAALLRYRHATGNAFAETPMYDDGFHGDGAAGDGVFGASVTVEGKTLQYYIFAENEQAAALSPERAEFEFYTVQPEILTGSIVVNEVKAGNGGWIELFNTTAEPFNLGGMSLEGDPSGLLTWTLPDTVLAPHGYLILYSASYTERSTVIFSFDIDTEEGYLLLRNRQLHTVDSLVCHGQADVRTTGRYPNGYGPFTGMIASRGHYNTLGTTPSAGFDIYPNPTIGRVWIELEGTGSPNTVTLTNAMGSVVRTLEKPDVTGPRTVQLDISGLPGGLYLVRVSGTDGEALKKLIIL